MLLFQGSKNLGGPVLLPGEIELIKMKERSQNGVPLSKEVFEDILKTSTL